MRVRVSAMMGGMLAIVGIWLPWVRFAVISAVDSRISAAVDWILGLISPQLAYLIKGLVSVNGWVLMLGGVPASPHVRALVGAPAIIGALTVLWAIARRLSGVDNGAVDAALAAGGVVVAVLLVVAMPVVQAFGIAGDYVANLVAAIGWARPGAGYWLSLLGMVLVAVGQGAVALGGGAPAGRGRATIPPPWVG